VSSGRVLARHRQELILSEVRRHGSVRVSELTDLLGVSDMTIRRDLDVLAASGLVDKVHGGATSVGQHSAEEPGFEAKLHRQLAEKEAIAEAAAGLIQAGSAIGITAGTTTWHLASCLADIADLVVVTNSIRVADVLHRERRTDLTVVLTGGVRTPSDALVGPVAVAALRALHVDQLFMGVHGMSDRAGFTTPNLLEAETNRAFADAAAQLVVLADHTKWGTLGLSTIVALDEADVVVTDARLPERARDVLAERVGRLLVVGAARSGLRGSGDPYRTRPPTDQEET
jgi:DeoR/GlpR family transcriptional regulator of sugar metabolism